MGESRGGVCAIDTHTHLNHPRLLGRLTDVLRRARSAGVREMIVVGYDVPSSELAVELAEQNSGLWAAVGVHPHDAAGMDDEAGARIRALAKSEKVVAIGETGLDFYRNLSPRAAQEDGFRTHLALAEEVKLPVIVHCRDAQNEVLDVLGSCGPSGVVWHCFDGTAEQAKRALELGVMLGFGGRLTYRSAETLRRVAAKMPADRILLETDCPYLIPEGVGGRDNEPANLGVIAECLAELRAEDPGQLERAATENARRVFALERERR